MPGFQPRVITIEHRQRDYEIAYSIRPGGSSAILYLHGLGSTKRDFEGALLVDSLSDHTLVAFDFPGCGQSTPYYNEIALGIDDLVAVTHKLATALELKDITAIGQSLGGLTALQFVRAHPERVARFVNVEGNLSPEDCDIQSRDVFRHRFLGAEEAFFEAVRERLNDPTKPGFEDFVAELRRNIVDRAYFDYCRSIVDYSDGFPLLEQFITLPVPIMFVHGSANSHLGHLGQLAEAGVPVVSVPDSDHFPALTNPNYYYGAISNFIHRPRLEPAREAAVAESG